jgi:2-keto-4-pentenoate hydratase/2-oxohepta-3-ene-1,7-dioic acid hydratase in catechol pathway
LDKEETIMRLATIIIDEKEQLALCLPDGCTPVAAINRAFGSQWPETMEAMIQTQQLNRFRQWFRSTGRREVQARRDLWMDLRHCIYGPPFRRPPKIWGIGLNYSAHARDLSEQSPTTAPASFMKPFTTIIGPGETIAIPELSHKTTAEAELGVIIGKRCKDVERRHWLDVVAGFTTILDMTAEDILRRNPRYLTMSKSFDTFFSFGPQVVTADEIEDIVRLNVSTVINGRTHAENTIDHMTFTPDALVAYHSQVMTLLPGDIISTGTPGAVPIQHGDTVQCRITGFETLENRVVDLKEIRR